MRVIYAVDIHGYERGLKKLAEVSNSLKADLMVLGGDINADLTILNGLNCKVAVTPGECDDIYITKRARELGILFDGSTVDSDSWIIGFVGGLSVHQSIRKLYERATNSVDLLVTHFPPKGCLDLVLGKYHGGLNELNSIIAKYKVTYVLTGHYHDNVGVCLMCSNALVMNPGPLTHGKFLLLDYNDTVIEYRFMRLP